MTLRITWLCALVCLCWPIPALSPENKAERSIEVWHGDTQRVGHLGDAQDDFNLMGHVGPWEELDTLEWRLLPQRHGTPLAFRAFRRLVNDGDFNADIPIGALRPGSNTVKLIARFRDGKTLERSVTVTKDLGARPLPASIVWSQIRDPQDVGQYVDGKWILTSNGLRTAQIGYDRVFLIGERYWKDYEVRTSVTIHRVPRNTTPLSGPNGVGIILRFAGHVTGGPRHFPSGQPKWGYQPFGSIGWLRWFKDEQGRAPVTQFYRGDRDPFLNFDHFPVREGGMYHLRYRCETTSTDSATTGVTRYSFRIWKDGESEPADWVWQQTQESDTALRRGGAALLAHHVDATFGDLLITEVAPLR